MPITKYVCPSRCSEDLAGLPIQPTYPDNPILMIIGEAPGCFTDGNTEVLTEGGWLPIKDCHAENKVAEYRLDGSIEFVYPSSVIHERYSGPVYGFYGGISTCVTPNHRFLVHNKYHKKFLVEEAETLRIKYTGQSIPISGMKKTGEVWNPDFIRLLVAVQADGTYDKTGIRFEFTKKRKKERIIGLLDSLGCQYRIGTDNAKGSLRITIPLSDKYYQQVMDVMPDKVFTWELLGLCGYGLNIFVEELHYWDGYRDSRISKGTCEEYSTGVKQNADVVQAIVHLVGKKGTIGLGSKGTYRVGITNRYKVEVRSLNRSQPIPYQGVVHCLTVPSRFFIVRSNNKVFVTGNSDETKFRRFFVGKAGQEMDNYLDRVQIPRSRCYTTNILKCTPPGNRDPKVGEVAICSAILFQELETVRPRFIAAVGRFATQFFLGDVTMEMVHGIPHQVVSPSPSHFPVVVIPVYHPSAGLHDTTNMSMIMSDFLAVKATMIGQIPSRSLSLFTEPPPYHLMEEGEDPTPYITDLVAVDTETQDEHDSPWCLQFSSGEQGHIVMWDNYPTLAMLSEHMANPDILWVIHNSLFDLKVLSFMDQYPARFVDTMVMAYLLQTEPQGLKALTFRHLGVRMTEYEEVVGPRTQEMGFEYLMKAMDRDWPKPGPILEMKAGKPKIRQPQSIGQKIKRMLSDLGAGKEVDILDRWYKTSLEEGRGMVEDVYGPMRRAYLKDVDPDEAYQYAATDPWATYHIYPVLDQKIKALQLDGVLNRDIGVIPMVETMQRSGMPLYPPHFHQLRDKFTAEMADVHREIEVMVGEVWPGSDPQVLQLVNDLGLVKLKYKKDAKGKMVPIRKKMVDISALELIKDRHPVIPKIMRWRSLAKLVDSFINVLLTRKDPDDRIRTKLRVTRVVTGRLSSSEPNLMAIPTRTEDGRSIRGGFITPPGYSFISNDYSQVEMRVVAHISQDKNMINVFTTGVDLHSVTAAGMFHIPIEQVDEMKHRYPAKRVGFGVLNLISAGKLLKEFQVGGAEGWTEADCQRMIDDWFKFYYGVADYVAERKAEARRTGMVRDMFGRIRLSPEVMSVHKQIQEAGIRQSVNAPIQQGAQGIIKEAMGQLVPVYKEFGLDIIKPLLQVHDDLIFECRDDMIDVLVPIIKDIMENCVKISVPLKVDTKVGKSWNNMKKYQ